MESKVRIILGILLVSLTGYQVECASLHHIRSVRDVELPASLNATVSDSTVTNKDVVTLTTVPVTQSSPSLQDKISKDTAIRDKNINKVESKSDDLSENESVKSSVEETLPAPKEKPSISRGSIKYQAVNQQEIKKENNETKEVLNKSELKVNETKEEIVNKNEEPKATGRSLNIDIEKYVSPEFHNKNNVYSLPTSPEIEKYLDSGSENFSEDVTKPTKRTFTSKSTSNDFNFDLTTPQSIIFDPKFQLLVDGIKQNLDELTSVTDHEENDKKNNFDNDTTTNYDVSKLIDNYKNADNETDVSLQTKEYKNIDIHADKNNGNKNVESGKNVNYESTNLKTRTYGEKPENSDVPVINKIPDNQEADKSTDNEKHEAKTIETSQTKKTTDSKESQQSVTTTLKPTSTTFVPSKKPRFQISLRNNTIETTAPDSEVKSKSIKQFSYESSSLDPLHEAEKVTYTKPVHENAINISKRGSTKFVATTEELKPSTTLSFMDYDNKNFSIPPTATAWTLVSLKDVSASSGPATEAITSDSQEQNSQENNLIKVTLTPPTKKEMTTDVSSSTENDLSSTTKYYRISSSSRSFFTSTTYNDETTGTDAYDDTPTSTEENTTSSQEKQSTTENITSTVSNEFSTTDSLLSSSQDDEITSENTDETIEHTAETTEHTDETTENSDETTENSDETTEHTTFNFKFINNEFTSTNNMNKYTTTSSDFTDTTTEFSETSTIEPDTTHRTETEQQEYTTEFSGDYETTILINGPSSTETASSTNDIKLISSKTESENELYTTIKPVSIKVEDTTSKSETESTTQRKTTEKLMTTIKFHRTSTSSPVEPEDDNFEEDYSDVMKKEKNITDANDPDIEIVPIDNSEQGSHRTTTPKKLNDTTTPISIYKNQKPIVTGNSDAENSTVDTTSSTDMLSHDETPEESNSGMIAAIVISSVGGICLVLLAGLLLIMRKRQKRVTYGQRCRPVSLDAYSLDNVSVYNSVRRKGALRASKRSYGNPAFDDPVSISHQMNFQALVKFAENVEDMSNEFDEIPQVTARANEVPPGCETKNRYANVIPLPETRVFLKASDNDPHSDYINANYVTGPKNTRGYYIACQAPMQNTVDDFWRMIWEQQCRVVLMLTNLYENGIEKCADYLPPSEVLDCHRLFGDFQITLKKREVKEKYIISSLQLKNMVSNSWREVTHLWYLGWPERGVPTETNSLIAFLIEARSHLKTASNNNSANDKTNESCNMYISNAAGSGGGSTPEGGPLVMHCSPGTGRTGTVIACDIAIRDFELTRAVDVPKIVYRVRRDRALAVQTRDQYAFIYKVISLYATKLTGGALDSI